MIGRSLVLFITFLPGLIYSETEGDQLSQKLKDLEDLIFETELETVSCQMHSAWHFPCQLYGYIKLARRYGNNLKKGKNSMRFQENLQCLLLEVDDCIQGKEGYWSGNWSDVWVDPVPSVPDCAMESFKKLKTKLEAHIPSLVSSAH